MKDAHVQGELLAYLDGELDAAGRTRVEAHLSGCQSCSAELAQLRELRYGLDVTLDTALSSVKLSPEADDRIREALMRRVAQQESGPRVGALGEWFRSLWSVRLRLAQGALALMVVLFSLSTALALNLETPVQTHEVLLLGEPRLAPGSRGALRVIVNEAGPGDVRSTAGERATELSGALTGSPVAGVSVVISLLTESGVVTPLFAGTTDDRGTVDAAFDVPELPEGPADLIVETASSVGTSRLTEEIALARAHKIYVMSDKPAYRPGQTIALRALALDAADLLPVAEGALAWSIRDAAGVLVGEARSALSRYGVATWSYELSSALPEGDYLITASLGDTRSERTVRVENYELPAFKVDLVTTRGYALPGTDLAGTVRAGTFFGLPVRSGVVVVRGFLPQSADGPVFEVSGLTDETGTFTFRAPLGVDLNSDELAVEAEVVSPTGQGAGIRRLLPVSTTPLVIQAVPESGALKPGVENVIILMVTTPDGQPTAAELMVTIGDERRQLITDRNGLASVTLVPGDDTQLTILARDTGGVEVRSTLTLATEDAEATVLLHASRAAYRVGDTLAARALVGGDAGDIVYLDVLRAGQMVAGLAAPVVDGAAEFALDLAPSLLGALELRAYAFGSDGRIVRDSRLVVVDPADALTVDVASDRERYAPGDLARLTFQTSVSQEGGEPVATPSLLAVSIVDTSVYALEILPPSFARTYMLISDKILARRGDVAALDLPSLLAEEAADREAQDLAARAAWAGVPVQAVEVQASETVRSPDRAAVVRQRSAGRLLIPLIGLGMLSLVLVLVYVRREGLARKMLRRMAIMGLILFLLAPILLAGVVLGLLLPRLGAVLFILALIAAAVLITVVVVVSLRRHWGQVQLFILIVIGYLILSGWMLALAARGAEVTGVALAAFVGSFVLLMLATLLEGQMILLHSMRAAGWSTVVLALILAVLAVTAPSVPALRSSVSAALGHPTLYVGPLGWLSGCAAGIESPAPVGTVVPEAAEAEPGEVLSTPAPTAIPAPTATPAPLDLPVEPYPLRQVFPETLYWNPEVETDAQGELRLDLALADSVTTWRVAALASTLDGKLGAGDLSLVVSQDLILDVAIPDQVTAGEAVTLALNVYNTTAQPVPVRWGFPDAMGFAEVIRPDPVVVAPQSGVRTDYVIRPDAAGTLSFELVVSGEGAGDRVLVEMTVSP